MFHLSNPQTQQSEGTDDSTRHTRSPMAKDRIWCIWAPGKPYLVVVDYYSKFIETWLMHDKTAGTIVTHMKSIFVRHWIPEELVLDNMPYNSKEFKHFASDWGFQLTTSSPTYPQANGLSEKAVQTIKRILKKTSNPYIGLLENRNTPVTGMTYSPSQLLMSRATRTTIPGGTELLQPKLVTEVCQQLKARQQWQVHYYNQGTKPLTTLKPQEVVCLRQGKTWTPAIVASKAERARSYSVTTTTGQQYHRNHEDLLQIGEPPPTLSVPEDNRNIRLTSHVTWIGCLRQFKMAAVCFCCRSHVQCYSCYYFSEDRNWSKNW